ncbi:MAG: hypothetical protein HC804_10680 [Anaerolineae bacterium]|nr:hypothetical protein [Anaerolineae bacterium]
MEPKPTYQTNFPELPPELANGRCETVYAQRLLEFVFEHYAAHLALADEQPVTRQPKQVLTTSPIYL